jgi:hypothetical protein
VACHWGCHASLGRCTTALAWRTPTKTKLRNFFMGSSKVRFNKQRPTNLEI